MDFIIGGAYQGKRAYAVEKYGLSDGDIYSCTAENEISFGSRCIDRLEEFALWCLRNGCDAVEYFKAHDDEWRDAVLISRDIFCGVVPIEAEQRALREMNGRLCAYLAKEADSVTRIYCGLEQKLK